MFKPRCGYSLLPIGSSNNAFGLAPPVSYYTICACQTFIEYNLLLIANRSWNVTTVVVLLNVLISLFSSAYDDVSFSHVFSCVLVDLIFTYHRSSKMLLQSTWPILLTRLLEWFELPMSSYTQHLSTSLKLCSSLLGSKSCNMSSCYPLTIL